MKYTTFVRGYTMSIIENGDVYTITFEARGWKDISPSTKDRIGEIDRYLQSGDLDTGMKLLKELED